jgi:hypothetical protein
MKSTILILLCVLMLLGVVWLPASAAQSAAGLAFKAASDGSFLFDTGVLRGKLRPGGKSLGLSEVVHVPSGLRLDRGHGLCGHYRVFTKGLRYGPGAWDWPSTAKLLPDGAVEVLWAPAEGRPFEMHAVYHWSSAAALDVDTIVKAAQDFTGFESFLACYFNEQFTNCSVYAQLSPAKSGKAGLLAAEKAQGDWQMFPRDSAAVALITDGRWKLDPNPVNWAIRPFLAEPLALRRAPASNLWVALLSPHEDCFAVATPHESEGHYSVYLSMFGRDLKTGEETRARARLQVGQSVPAPEPAGLHSAYRRDLRTR